jgi:hypothetical protein
MSLSLIQENFISYLSKELKISLSEAMILEKEIKRYSLNKNKLQEMSVEDIKKLIKVGTITASVILSSFSPMQASSDYFRMVSYNPKESDLKKLEPEQQKEVIKYAISHAGNPAEKIRLQNLLNQLEKNKRENYLKKTSRRKKRLDEINWNDVKTGITIASIITSSFIPSLQKVTAEGCDESSCSIEALQAKETIETKIDRIDSYLKTVNFEDAREDKGDFLKSDLDFARQKLLVLSKQNLNPEQKKYLKTVLQKIENAKKQLDSTLKTSKKESLRLYLCSRLGISLSEAVLLEKEIKNYIKIKKGKSLREM